ncbi:MAG: response regulator [Flavobacterium sp.]|uniref:tetratricopeptide repeat-containing hybrid sensor histidine kinase/response regulator n=1 Tax=Flavobacterium sp. TaxID=239 RepID=UPI003265E15C
MKIKLLFYFFLFILTQSNFAQDVVRNNKDASKILKKAVESFDRLDCKESLKFAQIVLKYSLANDDYLNSAKAYNIIGLNYEEFSDLNRAIDFYKKGIEFAHKSDNTKLLDYLYNNIGNLYNFQLNDPKKGLEYYFKCYKYSKKSKNKIEIAFTELNIADVYINLSNFKTGKKYLDNILPVVKSSNDYEMYITYYTLLANYYANTNEVKKAEFTYNLVINKFKENKIELLKSNQLDIYEVIYKFYKKNNDNIKALSFLEKHDSLQSALYVKERNQEIKFAGTTIEVLEMNSKIQKIESEKKIQEQIINEANKTSLIIIVSLFFLILLMGFLYRSYLIHKQINKKLFETNNQLIVANEKSEEASILKSQFLSNVSHELRTPLYGVIGMAEIIESEYVDIKNNQHFKALKFSSNYLLALINDVLNVYKIEDTKFEFNFDNFNIRKEIFTLRESLNVIAKSNNNVLNIEISENVPKTIKTDITRFSQIVINLISNSLKFTKNGTVTIRINLISENDKQFLIINIIDTGIGIPNEYLDKIFEKFVQVEINLHEQYKGTGLGLSIVKKLVELFKGEILVKSVVNKGTEFTVKLPYIEANQKPHTREKDAEKVACNKQLKILIVEDNAINQLVTKRLIEKNKHTWQIANNGFEALAIIENNNFDLILMDINMPIMNGFEASKELRKRGKTIPIIALTASDKQEINIEAKECGINDILVKPFKEYELANMLIKYID